MEFKEYQKKTLDTLITKETDDLIKKNKDLLIARLALGVTGEAGEVAEKVKKYLRGDYEGEYTEDIFKSALSREIGDVLWYCSALAHIVDLDLNYIAEENLKKLHKRKTESKIKGFGDNR